VDEHDVQEAKHGGAAVLDLHDLEAAHVARLDQAQGVVDAERRRHTNAALSEHGGRRGPRHGTHAGTNLQGLSRLEERERNAGNRLHSFLCTAAAGEGTPEQSLS